MSDGQKSVDVLGIAPYGEALNTVAKGGTDFICGLLTKICYPAAEEIGLAFQDNVRAWRHRNANAIAERAQEFLDQRDDPESLHAHPRLVCRIIEEGSWIDDGLLQSHWAGLLASSCTPDGKDESNLIFLDLMHRLTTMQARILDLFVPRRAKT